MTGLTCYTPKGWQQEPLRLIVRRMRIPVEELSDDPRSGRRVILRLAQSMLWAATFTAVYQRLRLLTPSA